MRSPGFSLIPLTENSTEIFIEFLTNLLTNALTEFLSANVPELVSEKVFDSFQLLIVFWQRGNSDVFSCAFPDTTLGVFPDMFSATFCVFFFVWPPLESILTTFFLDTLWNIFLVSDLTKVVRVHAWPP